jgi:hypothetical protein
LLVVFEDTPSLQFGSGAQSKREALLELAGLVMLLGAVNRDRVGFVHTTPSGDYLFREPVRGRGAILHAAASLLACPPPKIENQVTERSDSSASKIENPAIPWRLISRAAPKHSVLLWLGDFAPRPEPEGWTVLRRRYQTMGFRVDDPWERALPDQGAFAAYDPTAGQLVTIENSSAERAAHAAWRADREATWTTLFPDILSRLVVSTEENRLDALVRFFHARMRAGSIR